jgi:hypothetical protein
MTLVLQRAGYEKKIEGIAGGHVFVIRLWLTGLSRKSVAWYPAYIGNLLVV